MFAVSQSVSVRKLAALIHEPKHNEISGAVLEFESMARRMMMAEVGGPATSFPEQATVPRGERELAVPATNISEEPDGKPMRAVRSMKLHRRPG
jgi:hypothetical protein